MPPLFVNSGDSARRPREVIGEDDNAFPRLGISAVNPSELIGTLLAGVKPSQLNGLIGKDILHVPSRSAFKDVDIGIVFQAGDEVCASLAKGSVPCEVDEAFVEDNDISLFQGNGGGNGTLMYFARGYHGKRGQIPAVIQFDVQFDRTLGSSELCPIKKGEAE